MRKSKTKTLNKSKSKRKSSKLKLKKKQKRILASVIALVIIAAGLMSFFTIARRTGIKEASEYTIFVSTEQQILTLVNAERSSRGLRPLSPHSEATKVARVKSYDMSKYNYFSHNSPIWGSSFKIMKHFDIEYVAAGENIAVGYSGADSVMNGWMNSTGHRNNILSEKFTHLGIGIYCSDNGKMYYTQIFLTPKTSANSPCGGSLF